MSEENDTYPELRVRLEEYYKNIVENLQMDYFNYANNPIKENSRSEGDYGKFAKSLEQLLASDYDPTVFDVNKNILELINQLRSDNDEAAKLIALKLASIKKLDKDIEFYKNNTKVLKDAMKEHETNSKTTKESTESKRLAKAKDMFNKYKKNMNHIIDSLYPDKKNEISSFLNKICAAYLVGEGTDYVEMNDDLCMDIVELLKEATIISSHPHQRKMYKLNI